MPPVREHADLCRLLRPREVLVVRVGVDRGVGGVRVIDPGHLFALRRLDGAGEELLRFVKRNDPPEKYPGNFSAYAGTNIQEVLRALIARLVYLQEQSPASENEKAIAHLTLGLYELEVRAHRKHGVVLDAIPEEVLAAPACFICGHTFCSWCADSRHPGETHGTVPTSAAVQPSRTSLLLGPGVTSALQVSPPAGVEPAREIVVTIPVEDPPDCPCSACEGARMSFGHYQTGA